MPNFNVYKIASFHLKAHLIARFQVAVNHLSFKALVSPPPPNPWDKLEALPSTQAGLALVVPAIWPFLQAQRAVCLAMVRRGWLLSLSSVTISHVPAASWPANDNTR